ncbi:MAG: YlxR family protein [Chloroflexota bacterium]|nr:YlxR family protein [Chloroflexota bacterium]
MSRKHTPLRTCVGCRQVRPKREMVRIVRTLAEGIEIDERGKKSGRGAYLCRRQACWNKGMERGRIEHALKTSLTAKEQAMLQAYAESLPADDSAEFNPA